MRASAVNDPIERITAHAPALILAAAVAVLGAALAMQYLAGLAPCRLCIAQRWPYAAVIVLAGFALVPAAPESWRRTAVALGALAFAIGGAIAVYHVGVEQGWVAVPEACSGIATGAGTIEELRRALPEAPVVRCDEVPWTLFGFSMAGYNVAVSMMLAAFSAWAAVRWRASGHERPSRD